MCDCHGEGYTHTDDEEMFRCLNCGEWSDSRYCSVECADEYKDIKPFIAYLQAGDGVRHARIFIPYDHAYPSVVKHINRVCVFGGIDKDTGKCYGWEIPANAPGHRPMKELISYLNGYGYDVKKVGAGNCKEVWA